MVKKAKLRRGTCLAVGIDLSLSVIAISAKMYDGVLGKTLGPVWHEHRFKYEDDYFERLKIASFAHEHIHDCVGKIKGAIFDFDEIWIGIEEPVPMGMIKRGNSSSVKQQIEIQGSFLGGLLRYGFQNVIQINSKKWKAVVADDLDMKQNADFNKWSIVEWCKEVYPEIPDWPDLIRTNKGLVSKPESSVAKPVQPDDRFDATGLMEYTWEIAQKEVKVKRKTKNR